MMFLSSFFVQLLSILLLFDAVHKCDAAISFGNVLGKMFTNQGFGSVVIGGEFSTLNVTNFAFTMIPSPVCPSKVGYPELDSARNEVNIYLNPSDPAIPDLAVGVYTCTLQGTITMNGLTLAQESYLFTINVEGTTTSSTVTNTINTDAKPTTNPNGSAGVATTTVTSSTVDLNALAVTRVPAGAVPYGTPVTLSFSMPGSYVAWFAASPLLTASSGSISYTWPSALFSASPASGSPSRAVSITLNTIPIEFHTAGSFSIQFILNYRNTAGDGNRVRTLRIEASSNDLHRHLAEATSGTAELEIAVQLASLDSAVQAESGVGGYTTMVLTPLAMTSVSVVAGLALL